MIIKRFFQKLTTIFQLQKAIIFNIGDNLFFLGKANEKNIREFIQTSIKREHVNLTDGFSTDVGLRNASTRDEWIEKTLLAIPEGLTILDAGAGEMQYKPFCKHLKYTSQDLSDYDGSGDSSGLQTGQWDTSGIDIVSDICAIPVPDENFDIVMCTEVLEHLPNPVEALKELSRVTKVGGKLILTAPFCSLTHFAPYHFSTGFNKFFYLHHLPILGFSDIQIIENGNYFEYMAQELRRIEFMAEKYTKETIPEDEKYDIAKLLKLMNRLSRKDQGSSEMLHFDCQVLAIKKSSI